MLAEHPNHAHIPLRLFDTLSHDVCQLQRGRDLLPSANSVGKRRLFFGILMKRREEVGRRTETATVQIHFPAGEEV